MKKLVAILLCLVMLLSAASVASAAEKTKVVFWYSLEGTNAECIKQIVDDSTNLRTRFLWTHSIRAIMTTPSTSSRRPA